MTLTELRDTFAFVSDAAAGGPRMHRRSSAACRRASPSTRSGGRRGCGGGRGRWCRPPAGRRHLAARRHAPRTSGRGPGGADGELALVGIDGATPTGVQVSGLVGQGENGVVTLDSDRHVVVVQRTDDGIGVVRDLSGEPVASVAVSADAGVLVWVDEDRGSHERGAIDGSGTYETASGTRSAAFAGG